MKDDRPLRSLIFGIPVNNLTMKETTAKILQAINNHSPSTPTKYIATVNSDFVRNSHGWNPGYARNEKLAHILRDTWMVTADGMPIVWLSRLFGTPLKERVTGADLTEEMAKALAKQQGSIYFLGGSGNLGKQAAEALTERYPGLQIAGISAPRLYKEGPTSPEALEEETKIIEEINASGANLLLIGLGNPKQELWFHRVKDQLKVPVAIGIGGAFRFYADPATRAPGWVQKLGLEWVHRVIQDPKRLLVRYALDIAQIGYMTVLITPHLVASRYIACRHREETLINTIEKEGFLRVPENYSLHLTPRVLSEAWSVAKDKGIPLRIKGESPQVKAIAALHHLSYEKAD